MNPTLVQVPYHLGREGDFGQGVPVLAATLADLTESSVLVTREGEVVTETGACFDVVRGIAGRVAEIVAAGGFPLVLAGNCHSSTGTCAGLGRPVGVVWLDAHADFNTPETTRSGFFDGMALALLTGGCWAGLRTTVPGHVPVPEEHVVLVARDVDPAEAEQLARSKVLRVDLDELPHVLDQLRERVDDVYLHVDLDLLDPSVGRANRFAVEGGASRAEALAAVDAVRERFTIRAAALTAYTPDADPEGAIPPVARALAERIVGTAVAAS